MFVYAGSKNDLAGAIVTLRNLLRMGDRPAELIFGDHTCGIQYFDAEDEFGDFCIVGFTMPDGIFAEIEDGTYGTLHGFRIYYQDGNGE